MQYRYMIPLLFLLIAVIVSVVTYRFNSERSLENMKKNVFAVEREGIEERVEILRTLITEMGLQETARVFSRLNRQKNLVHAFLSNSEVEVIYSSDPQLLGENIKNILYDEEFAQHAKVTQANDGQVTFLRSKKRLSAFYPLHLQNGEIAVYHEDHDAQRIIAQLSSDEKLQAFMPALFFLVALLVTYLIIYQLIAKKMKHISLTLQRFIKGNGDERIALSGNDEVSSLARDIDGLLDTLQKKDRSLEEQNARLERSLAKIQEYKRALDESNIVSKSDLNGKITYVNDRFCEVSGFTREEVLGKPHSIIRHGDMPKAVFEELWDRLGHKRLWRGIVKNRKKDGGYYWIDSVIMPLLDERGEVEEYIAIRHDVTELIEQRQKLEKAVVTDSLTGLGNRTKLLGDIAKEQTPSMALLNLDNFREINDFYGHDTGDRIIRKFGNYLQDFFAQNSCEVYHLNGDEFALLNRSMAKDDFIKAVQKIIETMKNEALTLNGNALHLHTTASFSFESNKTELFTTADMAMKLAKKDRKDLLVYSQKLVINEQYEKNILWLQKLKSAIDEDRIVAYYQPIIDNATGRIAKYECLMRLIEPDGKVVSPFFFLDIAKRSKLYGRLTRIMVEKAFAAFEKRGVQFSLNLTVEDILDEQIVRFIEEKLQEYDVGERLVFEIVESESIDNYEDAIGFIEKAKSMGCQIAIDDFGTGYSNFDYLMKLKADYVKLDGSLIKNIDRDEQAHVTVEVIHEFAKRMGMKTVAEFVKDDGVYQTVKSLGIDYSQGFYLGEPAPKPME